MQLRRSRNKVVVGEPAAGVLNVREWLSGQKRRIVNPFIYLYVGSNPASPMLFFVLLENTGS